jgi:hypothetical protein
LVRRQDSINALAVNANGLAALIRTSTSSSAESSACASSIAITSPATPSSAASACTRSGVRPATTRWRREFRNRSAINRPV